MRIVFVPKNVDGSGWYRCFFPAAALEARGHFARAPEMAFFRADGSPVPLSAGQLPDGWIICKFKPEWPDADVYVLQMPLDDGYPKMVDDIHRAGKKVVVELDDDYLHVPAYNPFKGSAVAMHKCVLKADAVSVSTPSIASAYRHLNKNVTVLRNRLHWPMWANEVPAYEQTWRKTRIGWMGVLEYHRADLDVIKPWFGRWLANHPDLEFVSAGDDGVHDYLGVPEGQRVTTDRTDFRHLELAQITAVFDIGLVPLAKNKFNEGKSYLKGMEYSACGIVPICTPTSQYREFVCAGVDGELAAGAREWQAALEALVADPAKRKRMGGEARRKAQTWTYENHVDEWEKFFEPLCPGKKLLWGDGDNTVAAREEVAA